MKQATRPPTHDVNEKNRLRSRLKSKEAELNATEAARGDTDSLKDAIVLLKKQLLAYDYRSKRKNSPCELFLDLTIQSEKSTLYRIPYTRLHLAMKHLMKVLFGDRLWEVKKLKLHTSILRWPESCTPPVVKDLKIGYLKSTNLESLRSIVHPSSFPLDSFEMRLRATHIQEFDDEIITKAKLLIIQDPGRGSSWSPQLIKIQNLRVYVKKNIMAFDFEDFVSHWMEHGRPIGTCYTFKFVYFSPHHCMEAMRNRPDVLESSDRLVKLPMKNSAVLIVSYEKVAGTTKDQGYCWILELKVGRSD